MAGRPLFAMTESKIFLLHAKACRESGIKFQGRRAVWTKKKYFSFIAAAMAE
jgi:hypothetical protein